MKRAIALCGGGSRGAYELGVWRSIQENGIKFHIIAGTSIGALNGALMAQGDYEATQRLWETITIDSIMENGINLDTSIEAMLNQKDNLLPFLKKYIACSGADISPLKELVRKAIDEEKVRKSPVDLGLVAVQFPSLKPMELTKKEIPLGALHDWLLASAACFPAFPMQKIAGKAYIDGGYHDNLPIGMAIRMGGEEVVAVDLSFGATHKEYQNRPCVTYIHPSWDLGSILMFDPELMRKNTELGYLDAQKAFGKFLGFRFTFVQNHPERKYKKAAQKLAEELSLLEAKQMAGTRHPFQKQAALQMTANLTENTGSVLLGKFEYLLRSLEVCGEILGVDHYVPYDFSEFIMLLRNELSNNCGLALDKLQILRRTSLSAEGLAGLKRVNRKELLCAAYRILMESQEPKEDMFWMASVLPRSLAGILGLYQIERNL